MDKYIVEECYFSLGFHDEEYERRFITENNENIQVAERFNLDKGQKMFLENSDPGFFYLKFEKAFENEPGFLVCEEVNSNVDTPLKFTLKCKKACVNSHYGQWKLFALAKCDLKGIGVWKPIFWDNIVLIDWKVLSGVKLKIILVNRKSRSMICYKDRLLSLLPLTPIRETLRSGTLSNLYSFSNEIPHGIFEMEITSHRSTGSEYTQKGLKVAGQIAEAAAEAIPAFIGISKSVSNLTQNNESLGAISTSQSDTDSSNEINKRKIELNRKNRDAKIDICSELLRLGLPQVQKFSDYAVASISALYPGNILCGINLPKPNSKQKSSKQGFLTGLDNDIELTSSQKRKELYDHLEKVLPKNDKELKNEVYSILEVLLVFYQHL